MRRGLIELPSSAISGSDKGGGLIMNETNRKKLVADSILMKGRIATMDERRSYAQAVAIKGGRFIAVGSDQEIMAYKGEKTKVIKAGGRTVIPGLNDSHIHTIRGGLNYNMELRWDGVPSLAMPSECCEQAQRTPSQWVRVVGDGRNFNCRAPHANARRD
jgi:predicted amidohydrolase YtcJ